ncbi:MAG: FAD-binding oxidoreductase [Actinomycetes bacterium]
MTTTVHPASTAEVAEVLRRASADGTPLVAVGGGTGLADATRASDGEISLLTDRLKRLAPVDMAAAQVTVGAGVTLAELENHVRAAGLEFPLDLGARQTAHLGGMAASNAGGSLAWRFGSMRDLVAGFEAVLADGSIVGSLAGLQKDNAGYDLRGLFMGSEGTLGVITALRLKLVQAMPARATALIAAGSPERALAIGVHLRSTSPELIVCDFIAPRGTALTCARLGVEPPVQPGGGWLVLAELGSQAGDGIEERLASAIADSPGGAPEAAVAADSAQRDAIWRIRDSIYEACEATGPTRKLDLSVGVSSIPGLAADVLEALAAEGCDPATDIAVWGHLLDGNFHATLMGPAATAEVEMAATLSVQRHGGSVAAEHGVGRQRLAVLGLTRTPSELAAMRAIRAALDPAGILARGRALPD